MQLLLSLSLSLLTIMPAICWPMNDNDYQPQNGGGMIESYQSPYLPPYDGGNEGGMMESYQGGDGLMLQRENAQQQYFDYAERQDEEKDVPLPEKVAEDLKKQIEREKNSGGMLVETEATSSGRVLRQGCTVALQTTNNALWLGCAGGHCVGAPCPGKFFEGADINNCWGEVFRLYRAGGQGNILSGDYVGLYYPREGRWFSMWNGIGHKEPCPGNPTVTYGFHSSSSWYWCGGEVFQVFAKGKANGATITDQDTLAFFYPCGYKFVSFQANQMLLSSCINSCPPSSAHFDRCTAETVEITILD